MDLSHSQSAVLYSLDIVPGLWFGTRPAEYKILEHYFAALITLPITAACAAATGAILWTRIRKHYPMKDIGFF